jgi:hypothetical protein
MHLVVVFFFVRLEPRNDLRLGQQQFDAFVSVGHATTSTSRETPATTTQ